MSVCVGFPDDSKLVESWEVRGEVSDSATQRWKDGVWWGFGGSPVLIFSSAAASASSQSYFEHVNVAHTRGGETSQVGMV